MIDFKIGKLGDQYVVACYPAHRETDRGTATAIYIKHKGSFWVASKYQNDPIDWGDSYREIPVHVKTYITRYLKGVALR